MNDDDKFPTYTRDWNICTRDSLQIAETSRLNIPPPNNWGLFARRRFLEVEIIGKYTGERLNEDEHNQRYPGNTRVTYSFTLNILNINKYEYIEAGLQSLCIYHT